MTKTSPPPSQPTVRQSKKTGALLLAAGFSRRFNGCKLAATLPDGQTLFSQSLASVRAAFDDVMVIGRQALLDQGVYDAAEGLDIILNPDAEQGMGSTLACGASMIPDDWQAAAICLADMPRLNQATLAQLIAAAQPDRIVIPIFENRSGHPVIFGAQFFAALQQCHGDNGARQVLQTHPDAVLRLPVNDSGILLDVDDRDALARLTVENTADRRDSDC
jgi:molybdenum cofactor cytidylyltransferase